MPRQWTIWTLSVLLFILPVSLASAQNPRPPKTIAFIVGVQNYDDPDLDKLQYTVADAQKVFEQLKAITDLDLRRSRLLLADPEATDAADPTDPDWLVRKNRLALQDIQDELANFLENIEKDETVIFYFGGHGTVQARQHLLFLPSDYSRRPQKRYLRYTAIFDDIRGRISDRQLRNVKVVFFANMCGAGTAAGQMSAEDDLTEESVKDWLEKNTLGFERFALFPASAPNQNTFEHPQLKSSVFAHHLVEGLRGGAAARGVITTESLFDYLDEKIQDELPKNPNNFDPTIPIGVTREIEGRALYLDGLSLLSTALDTDDRLLWRLAERNLREAVDYSGVGRAGGLAALRLAQARAAQGASLTEISDILAPVTRAATTNSDIRDAAASLLKATENSRSRQFVAVLVSMPPFANNPDNKDRENWKNFLKKLPGFVSMVEVKLSLDDNDRIGKVTSIISELNETYKNESNKPHLIFVYSGMSSPDSADEKIPFNIDTYRVIIAQWGAPFTLIYDSPFGAFIKNAFEEGKFGDVSFVLAARETNGMTFIGGSILLIDMLKSNVLDVVGWDRFEEHRKEMGLFIHDRNEWVIGTPYARNSPKSPSPVFGGTETLAEASASLSPVRRLASLVATGCDPDCIQFAAGPMENALKNDGVTASIAKAAAPEPAEVEPAYDMLKKAALSDFGGNMGKAHETYQRFLRSHEELHKVADDQPAAEIEFRAKARSSLDKLINQVRSRVEGLEGKFSREVHLMLAGVPEYRSPLVPDLVDAQGDLDAWKVVMDARMRTPVNLHMIDTSSRRELLETLRRALTQVGVNDLVLFVFSGRGVELEGERYLAMADVFVGVEDKTSSGPLVVNLEEELVGAGEPDPLSPAPNELVSIAEIADLAREHWFVGIYDAQFSEPIFKEGRPDSLLDKHLNSVRPSRNTEQEEDEEASEPQKRPFLLAGGKNFPVAHVHIWGEGRLTERLSAPSGCQAEPAKKVRSPMTAALVAALQENSLVTYAGWIQRAQEHSCLGQDADFVFVVQGAADLPLFASAKAATQISYFLGENERRDTNLDCADGITAVALRSGDHPLFKLSRAAVLVAQAEFVRSAQNGDDLAADRLDEAVELLEALRQSSKPQDIKLEAESLDLLTRALDLSGKIEDARSLLLQAAPDQLRSDSIQMRLLDLTEKMLRQSPTGILDETRKQLANLDIGPDVETRMKNLTSSYTAPKGQYRIVMPAQSEKPAHMAPVDPR